MTLSNLLTEQAAASLAHKIVSAEQVRKLEPLAAKDAGCSMFDLMQRAGEAAFKVLLQYWPKAKKLIVICGNGNNAGDGYVLARLAKSHGLKVLLACQDPKRTLTGDAQTAQDLWNQIDGQSAKFEDTQFNQFDVLVDALLGTGISGEVKPEFQQIIERINQAGRPILSLDLPSGMHADNGRPMPACVEADVTISFVAIKPGLVTGIGKTYCGTLEYADLAVGEHFFKYSQNHAQLVDWQMLHPLSPRPNHGNKGTFGKLLCIGGNQGMSGAIRLTAESALRSGVGLVKVFCHKNSLLQVSSGRPEIMVFDDNLEAALDWCDCVAFGPGLGTDIWSRAQFEQLMGYLTVTPKPLIIDADGLNLLAEHRVDEKVRHILSQLPACVVTPHPGEAARLLGKSVADIEQDRFYRCKAIAEDYSVSCLLKGAGTIICTEQQEDDKFWVCQGGNPGMATAGMGDMLSGVIGAFLGQGMPAYKAMIYGVCAHAEAGDRVASQYGQRGMIASDLFMPLRGVINAL